jgi:hypothetical protein
MAVVVYQEAVVVQVEEGGRIGNIVVWTVLGHRLVQKDKACNEAT